MIKKNKIKVLLADDHPLVRFGIKTYFECCDDIILVGEAENGKKVLEICEKRMPDVVLMDLKMPKLDGIETSSAIQKKWPDIKIIILTSFIDKELIQSSLKAGASSYLLKNEPANRIVEVIKDTYQGKSNLSPEATKIIVSELKNPSYKRFKLTFKEKKVLSLMSEGLSNKEIANRLTLSTSTIQFHITNILSKLGTSNRTKAIYIALKQKLLKLPGINH